MSLLLKKSEENKTALIHLKSTSLYASSVHCGYYSCIQKLIYIFKEFYPSIYESSIDVKGGKGNTHGYYIRQFSKILKDTFNDAEAARISKRKLLELKTFRLKSDYQDIEITEDNVIKVESYVDDIHGLIKKYIKI